MSSADEDAAGISASLGDEGAALQRTQDKIATMQARAGALDELPRSGVLEDAGSDTDDIQQELDEAGSPPKWTRNSPRLRPRPARARRRRPS
jgi:phage shock protein A